MAKHTPTPWRGDIGIAGWQYFDSADPHQEPNRLRIVACVNAFHSEDGREIPTEAITPGLFWEMREALDNAHKAIEACLHAEQNPGNGRIDGIAGEAVWKARKSKRALLAKLEPQK